MSRYTRTWPSLLSCALGAMFAAFAYVQINDTDPAVYHRPSVLDAWSWVFFYGFVAVLCILSAVRTVPRTLLLIAGVFCLVQMARTAPGLYENLFVAEHFAMTASSMAASRPEVELTREFFGAFIALLAIVFLRSGTNEDRRE